MKTLGDRIKAYIQYKGISQADFSKSVGRSEGWVNNAGKTLKLETANAIQKIYTDLNISWLATGNGSMLLNSNDDFLSHVSEPPARYNPTTKDISKEIEKAKKSKTNGKQHNSNDGEVLSSGDTVEIKTFVIPMKGFSGLKNAIYDDQYITEHFEQTTTEVPHHLYSPVSYRIQSSGKSMPISIPNNAWVTGVPVPEMSWLEYKFNPEKIYILFHPYRGILFKKVRNLKDGEIMLCSENTDKEEYPDEVFKIIEFRKILLAIKVELFI